MKYIDLLQDSPVRSLFETASSDNEMITDRREIEFNFAAMMGVIAASDVYKTRPTKLVIQDQHLVVFFGHRSISLSDVQIGALLISHCMQTGIPIPRSVKRSIKYKPEAISLQFRTVITTTAKTGRWNTEKSGN